MEEIKIVYRVRSESCLYFEGVSSQLQLPTRVTSTTSVECSSGLYLVPRIPGREIARVLGLGDTYVSDLLPPCEYLDAIASVDHVVDVSRFLELRFISYADRVTGIPVRCSVVTVKPGVLFEGVIRSPAGKACQLLEALESLRMGVVVGGLRLIGCGLIRLEDAWISSGEARGYESVLETVKGFCRR